MKKVLYNLFVRYREQISYLFFGGVTTLVNIGAYALLARSGLSTAWSNALAWILSVLVAYITNRLWVFRSRSTHLSAIREFAAFVACRAATGLLDEIIMVVGVDRLHLPGLAVKIFANALVIILNYVLSKLIIFGKSRQK